MATETLLRGHYGQYRVHGKIGKGGFATVYQAEMEWAGMAEAGKRLVAIKAVWLDQKGARESFLNEVAMLRSLKHPAIPMIYDAWQNEDCGYLAIDFIAGETLEAYLERRGGRVPIAEAVQMGLQLCAILEYLHSQQPAIIFRDLKPANVMRAPDGRLWLIDFGVARRYKPGQACDTRPLGSPGHASPEQYQGAPCQSSPRSDVYSLAALLHQLITGYKPPEQSFHFIHLPIVNNHTAALVTNLDRLLQAMVSMDIEQRPPLADVTTHLHVLLEQQALRQSVTRPAAQRTRSPRLFSLEPRGKRSILEEIITGGLAGLERWAKTHPVLAVLGILAFLAIDVAIVLATFHFLVHLFH